MLEENQRSKEWWKLNQKIVEEYIIEGWNRIFFNIFLRKNKQIKKSNFFLEKDR